MALDMTPDYSNAPLEAAAPPPHSGNLFNGPKGLRAGWRIVIFMAIVMGLAVTVAGIMGLTPAGRRFAQASRENAQVGVVTPAVVLVSEGMVSLLVLAAAGFMTLIRSEERRVGKECSS